MMCPRGGTVNQLAPIWVALIVGGVITGASVVATLVVRRSMELPAALLGLIGFGIAAFAFAELFEGYGRADAALWALGFMIAAAGGGYALASTLLYRFGGSPSVPTLPDPLPDDNGVTSVILVASVEPESYDPRETAQMLQSLADEGILNASIGVLPFLFFAEKTRYRVVADDSPSESEMEAITDRIRLYSPDERLAADWSTCSGRGSLAHAVVRAVARGHRRIVIAELFVAEPAQLAEEKRLVAGLHLDALGIDVRFTGPLTDAERVLSMLSRRVMRSANDTTGVVLVGHGQPEERAKLHPDFDEQEMTFINRLRMLLVEQGIPENLVRVAWAEWGTPDVTSSVRHLAALGCQRVLVVPAVHPLDTVATSLDLEIAVRQARVDEATLATTLPPWRDDEAVVEELMARIRAELDARAPV